MKSKYTLTACALACPEKIRYNEHKHRQERSNGGYRRTEKHKDGCGCKAGADIEYRMRPVL